MHPNAICYNEPKIETVEFALLPFNKAKELTEFLASIYVTLPTKEDRYNLLKSVATLCDGNIEGCEKFMQTDEDFTDILCFTKACVEFESAKALEERKERALENMIKILDDIKSTTN